MSKKIILLLHILLIASLIFKTAQAQIPVLWGMTSRGVDSAPYSGSIFCVNGDGSGFADKVGFSDTDGLFPFGNLSITKTGTFYGMTTSGGSHRGGGVIFKFDSASNVCTALYDFDTINGRNPNGNLLMAGNSIFYGLTYSGGVYNNGVIFSFDTTTATYTKLFDFNDTLGSLPNGSLIQAANGKLYGLTQTGGKYGAGIVFSFNITTDSVSDIHDFDGRDGGFPNGNLLQAYDGKLYGLTTEGGANGDGVIFSIDTIGNYDTLFSFANSGGINPYGSLIQTADSLFYGLTSAGGINDSGTIFNFNATTLAYNDVHDMDGINGKTPLGSLLLATDNKLYGTTCYGGTGKYGTVFGFDPSNNYFFKLVDFNYGNGANPHGDLVELSQINGISTSVNSLAAHTTQLSVYPNPSSGAITISSTHTIDAIKITNVPGQVIYSATPNGQQVYIQLNDAGMYFITITSGNTVTTGKVVVSR